MDTRQLWSQRANQNSVGLELLDLVTNQTARAAVVRGMPDELTGYEAGSQPGYSVLLCVATKPTE